MLSGLLYFVGLITVVVTIVVAVLGGAPLLDMVTSSLDNGLNAIPATLAAVGSALSWTVTPLVAGLLLMALGRVIMLLGAINRSLRGVA